MAHVTQKNLAERLGVDKSHLNRLVREGGDLYTIRKGGFVDDSHPDLIAWCEFNDVDYTPPPTTGAGRRRSSANTSATEELTDLAKRLRVDLEDLESMTLFELYKRYTTSGAIKDFVVIVKSTADTYAKYLANDKTRGELIQRELVVQFVNMMESCFSRMVTDGPPRLATDVFAIMPLNPSRENLEEVIYPFFESLLRHFKEDAVTFLQKLKAPKNDD